MMLGKYKVETGWKEKYEYKASSAMAIIGAVLELQGVGR